MFGEKHRALTNWLNDEWWSKGPPVCVISGFPGTGKTEVAVQAMNALKQARPQLPIAFFNCIESKSDQTDDLLLTITEELAADGDREPLERLERGEDVAAIFNRILAPPRLIVADEAQRLLVGSTGAMPKTTASLLERWSQTVGAKGRLLLLASREFDFARWSGRVEFCKLGPLEPEEAEAFLRASLESTGRMETVPERRIKDVVTWLGCNPRAIRLLVSALARESLQDLIGLATEAWEVHDREVSPELLREFEEAILNRAEERLDGQARVFLSRVSVLRQPADGRALQALRPEGSDVGLLRDELVARFMLELRRNRYEMHPVLRDTVRARMTAAERRRVHLAAGRYYAAPFRARRTLGTAEKLGARFIEARYHFTLAESEADLDDISQRFEAHYRAQFGLTTPVPTDPEERDERITLLSALLQARGAKGLEYHLARLLSARGRPGDEGRALPHARRATGPQSPEMAWVLRIRLEAREFGAAQAAKVAREAVTLIPAEQRQPVYQLAGEILAGDGKPGEAVELLRQGIKEVRSEHSLFSLYQAAGEILARDGKPGEAVVLLRQGIKEVRPEHNLYSLYQAAGEILARDGKPGEAVVLLRQGIKEVRPEHSLYSLYQAAGEILARDGKPGEAVVLLRQGIKEARSEHSLFSLYQAAGEILARDGKPGEAVELLRQGIKEVRPEHNLYSLYQAAGEILARDGKPGEAVELLRQGIKEVRPEHNLSVLYQMAANILTLSERGAEAVELLSEGSARIPLGQGGHRLSEQAASLTLIETPATNLQTKTVNGGPVESATQFTEDKPQPAAVVAEREALPAAASSFDPTRVLTAMRPDRWYGLYVLGCYDKAKTVYAQQCRALTLIHALFAGGGELQQGSRLGIIGGGAAGVTAAAAAACKGAKVILFERAEHLLPLQRQNTKRYLHPHLFDWPAVGSTAPYARLPLLDWQADRANAVAAEIGRSFDEIVKTSGNIELRLGTSIQDVERVPSADETRRVQVLGAEGEINEIVDVAIIAVGFGLERRNRFGIESPPYWEDDGVEQALGASPERPQRILVSGAGDGALIDLLRATLRDFRHEDIVALLPEGDALRKLEYDLQTIESKAKRASFVADGHFLNLQAMYSGLELIPSFLDQMRERIRDDTEVWFNFTSAGRYTLASSMLNRFLVSVLIRLDAIKPKLARLTDKAVTRGPSGEYAVAWPQSTEPQIFDRVVVRHGPPADYLSEVFPQLEVPCAPLRGKLRDLGLTGSLDEATRAYFTR